MICELLSVVVIILPSVIATIFQLNAWPFECYPMFSKHFSLIRIEVIRIGYEDHNLVFHWWRPHYYKLTELFGDEARACFHLRAPQRKKRLAVLFKKIEACMPNDPEARNVTSICLVVRRCRDEKGHWLSSDRILVRKQIAPRLSPAR
jgi:hypothetical protein